MQHNHDRPQLEQGERPISERYVRRLRDAPLDAAFHLLESSPDRRATTLGEARAAAYADGRMRRAGFRVSADAFRTWIAPVGDVLLTLPIAVTGIALYYWFPWIGFVLLMVAFALIALGIVRQRPLLGRARPSQNIVGIRAAQEAVRRRVVLLAPLDTPHLDLFLQRVGSFRGVQRIVLCSYALMACASGLGLVFIDRIWLYLQIVACVLPLIASISDAWHYFDAPSPGAVSHASALAVLVSACERVEEFEYVEVWAVGLGASMYGDGLNDFLRRYPFEPADTLFIGLESLGSQATCYVSLEGWPAPRRAEQQLLDLLAALPADDTAPMTPCRYANNDTLAAALARRGFRSISIMGLDPAGQRPRFGSALDTAEYLDAAYLEQAAHGVAALLRRVEAQLAALAAPHS